jgi:hypothetical protein
VFKYILIIFFYFLKIIFNISTSKRSKKYKPHSILAKKKKKNSKGQTAPYMKSLKGHNLSTANQNIMKGIGHGIQDDDTFKIRSHNNYF